MEKEKPKEERHTFEEWERIYASGTAPQQKAKLMTETEYRRYKYKQLVKGRLAKAKNILLSMAAKSVPIVEKIGKNATEAAENGKL
ncbi:MAG: hypothetical protein QXZ38_04220 [Candidatus Micrarchaeaceae archaeon]